MHCCMGLIYYSVRRLRCEQQHTPEEVGCHPDGVRVSVRKPISASVYATEEDEAGEAEEHEQGGEDEDEDEEQSLLSGGKDDSDNDNPAPAATADDATVVSTHYTTQAIYQLPAVRKPMLRDCWCSPMAACDCL